MEIRRLAWSGVEVHAAGRTLVIDFVDDFASLHGIPPPPGAVPPPPVAASVDVALVTHLHGDHADPAALARAMRPSGPLLRPHTDGAPASDADLVAAAERALADGPLTVRPVAAWETVEIAPFTITAVPAVDAFGDPQVSWCVTCGEQHILHCGDTLFHGWWWRIAAHHGPFDVAFMPVGGAVVDLPSRQPPSPLPAGMGPVEAAVAGKLVGARQVVPIHYGPLHESPTYVQADDPVGALRAAADRFGVAAIPREPGERWSVGAG